MTGPQYMVVFFATWFALGLAVVGLWNAARWAARRSKFGRTG